MRTIARHWICLSFCVLVLSACQSQQAAQRDYMPRIGGNYNLSTKTTLTQLKQLELVATNLVSVMVQIPTVNPSTVTLQVSKPNSAFGNSILKSLEEAGYGIQHVSADQGKYYVSYGRRLSETEAGLVVDYTLSIGRVKLQREYVTVKENIYPSSLLVINGTREIQHIALNDSIFKEQGGSGDEFISGIEHASSEVASPQIGSVQVNDYDATPEEKRLDQGAVLSRARRTSERPVRTAFEYNDYIAYRRSTLIFDNKKTTLMGRGNKQAIRLLVREFQAGDIFEVTACTDVDGKDEAALARGIRLEEEFLSHGLSTNDIVLAPCIRASYRHASDNSPVPVVVVHHRLKNDG